MYLIRTPGFIQRAFKGLLWRGPSDGRDVFLTFDDGPTLEATSWVLDTLRGNAALGTFFCVGSNAMEHGDLMVRIRAEGHGVGNHTYDHADGWKVTMDQYMSSVSRCAEVIPEPMFRPPYGHLTPTQMRRLSVSYQIVMWDVLSADFDERMDGEKCADNVIKNLRPGSIVVFHDSVKAWPRLRIALPLVLDHCKKEGYQCKKITGDLT